MRRFDRHGLHLAAQRLAGVALSDQARLAALTDDAVTTSLIEGERPDAQSVRSSIARRAFPHRTCGADAFRGASRRSSAAEDAAFLGWANRDSGERPLVKAGLAHLGFVTLHPFDDGNGRIARALGDLFLASSQWAAIAKCSPDTALRDIGALLDSTVLRKAPGSGRSTAHELAAGLSGEPESAPQHTPHSP